MKPGQMHSVVPLDPPLPVETPDGPGLAYFIRDYGADHDDWWTVALNRGPKVGQFRTYRNADIRAVDNETVGRSSKPETSTTSSKKTKKRKR